jgi:hypothetical protein
MTGEEFRKSRGMVDSSDPKEGTTGNMEPPPQEKPPEEETQQGNPDDGKKLNLAEMRKEDIFKFAGKRKLYDKSFKELEQEDLINALLEKARAKVVEAGLKSAEEIAAVGEDELFALFDSIGK